MVKLDSVSSSVSLYPVTFRLLKELDFLKLYYIRIIFDMGFAKVYCFLMSFEILVIFPMPFSNHLFHDQNSLAALQIDLQTYLLDKQMSK